MNCVADTLRYVVYTVTVLEFASDKVVRRGVVISTPLNLFMNNSWGSDILGNGVEPSWLFSANTDLKLINVKCLLTERRKWL